PLSPEVERMMSQVSPVLHQFGGNAEANGRLAPEVAKAMVDAGVMRAMLPRVYGGSELSPTAYVQLIEELSHADSAAGWVALIASAVGAFTAILPKEGSDEILADRNAVVVGAWFPPGAAEAVQGGYRISGRWNFGSGCHYATWFTAQVVVMENGAMK